MTARSAFDRLAGFFARRPSRQGWAARRSLGHVFPSDEVLRDQLIGRAQSRLRPDGGAADTATVVASLADLIALDGPVTVRDRSLDWLLGLVGQPGAFGEGCTAARHAHRVCEHFLGGFFSVAPPAQRAAPATMPNGKVYRIESQARFATSVWALEVAVEGGRHHDPGVQKHLDSFAHLVIEWDRWDDMLTPDLAFGAIGALGQAPERWRPVLESLVRIAAHHQSADGTWPRVDFFNALAGLARVDHPLVLPMLERALPSLLQRQREDGSFGNVVADERALVGFQVLRRLT